LLASLREWPLSAGAHSSMKFKRHRYTASWHVGVEFDSEKALSAENCSARTPIRSKVKCFITRHFVCSANRPKSPGTSESSFSSTTSTAAVPERALNLLESIKLVLGQKSFVFVMALDENVLSTFLDRKYQSHGRGALYLHKIIQLPIWIPDHTQRIAQYVDHVLGR